MQFDSSYFSPLSCLCDCPIDHTNLTYMHLCMCCYSMNCVYSYVQWKCIERVNIAIIYAHFAHSLTGERLSHLCALLWFDCRAVCLLHSTKCVLVRTPAQMLQVYAFRTHFINALISRCITIRLGSIKCSAHRTISSSLLLAHATLPCGWIANKRLQDCDWSFEATIVQESTRLTQCDKTKQNVCFFPSKQT